MPLIGFFEIIYWVRAGSGDVAARFVVTGRKAKCILLEQRLAGRANFLQVTLDVIFESFSKFFLGGVITDTVNINAEIVVT